MTGKPSENVELQGKENENGDFSKGKTINDGPAGEIVPYNTVVEQYKSEALEDMNNSSLPSGMEDIVKDYFTGLE